ncbi:MAG: sulfatase-like hydrolase/transferase [Bacillota bacterium]
MDNKKPNLIIICADEMRGDCAGFAGNPDCLTPNLDRFASRGVFFTQHFCVHGKCVPSRVSMVTGRYAHTDGFRTINRHLAPGEPNLLDALKKLDYETAVFGHNHVWEGFWGDNSKGGGCVDYHSYTRGYFDRIPEKRRVLAPPGPGAKKPLALEDGFDYEGRIEGEITGFSDYARTEQAVHYLRSVRDRSRPFFMQLNFGYPHPAYRVEEPYFSMYDRDKIKPWPCDLPRNAPLPLRIMRKVRTGAGDNPEAFREIQAVYYGMITRTDALAGEILNEIEREGLLENSIVIFTSDHGDFAGQYGLVEKWDTCLADCIMHVPFILYSPGLPGGKRVDDLTEHTDLVPTVLALLGAKPEWGVHGESLLPVISGERKKEAVFADGGHEQEMWGRFNFAVKPGKRDGKQETYAKYPETMARAKMVRTKDWKLVARLVGGDELYDLAHDPFEMNNLYGDPAYDYIVLDLQRKLIQWCLRTDTDRPFQPEVGA